jgi:hypothetical protein
VRSLGPSPLTNHDWDAGAYNGNRVPLTLTKCPACNYFVWPEEIECPFCNANLEEARRVDMEEQDRRSCLLRTLQSLLTGEEIGSQLQDSE